MYGVLTLSFLYKPLNGQREHSANKYIRTLERKKKKSFRNYPDSNSLLIINHLVVNISIFQRQNWMVWTPVEEMTDVQ